MGLADRYRQFLFLCIEKISGNLKKIRYNK